MDLPDVMTAQEVAPLFRVSAQTIANWADEGLIPFFKTPRGQRRFYREDVEAFRKKQGTAA